MNERDYIQEARAFYAGAMKDPTVQPDLVRVRSFHGVQVVYSDEPGSVCPGGKELNTCETSSQILNEVTAACEQTTLSETSGSIWNTFAWTGSLACGECQRNCEGAALIKDGEPQGVTRVSFIEQDDSMPVLELAIDVAAYGGSQITPEELAELINKPGETH